MSLLCKRTISNDLSFSSESGILFSRNGAEILFKVRGKDWQWEGGENKMKTRKTRGNTPNKNSAVDHKNVRMDQWTEEKKKDIKFN